MCAFREHASRVSFKLLRGPSARCYVPFRRSSVAVVRRSQERTIERIEFDRLTLRALGGSLLRADTLEAARNEKSIGVETDREISRTDQLTGEQKRTNEYVVYIVALIKISRSTLGPEWSGKGKEEENTGTK